MNNSVSTYPVVIVGGGPVGLFLGICLEQAGIKCRILEKQSVPNNHPRALGIHPPSLEIFKSLGIHKVFIEKGIKIRQGHAFANSKKIGSLSFQACPEPFNYVLSLPQNKTEEILECHLNQLNTNTLVRKASVLDFSKEHNHLEIIYKKDGQNKTVRANFLVGCDGKESIVRKNMDISFKGESYPDKYVMGDFEDNTSLGNDVAIFLCDEGLIESIPIPGNKRRWVVKTNQFHSSNHRQVIEKAVSQRIAHSLSTTDHFMLSSFGVEKRYAQHMFKKKVLLAGDAAHIVSPIGGQGMNLGWLGARDLGKCLEQIILHQQPSHKILEAFENRRIKAMRNAIKRSELNMWLGRKVKYPQFRNGIVSIMLNTPLSTLMARLFTMRGIQQWII
jgi:2-polyprenyl-6-methoxyphenol hydroxylase-like FAD-dependent oxidoreductase